MAESNPLILSGEYERVYVCELEPGDVNAFDQTIRKIDRVTDNFTRVHYTDGTIEHYGRGQSTMLIKRTN